MATINYRQFASIIAQSDDVSSQMRSFVEEAFEAKKAEMIREFDNHPVSQEISAGLAGNNEAGTLDGVGKSEAGAKSGGKPNLFSFIGFDANSTPITDLREVLETQTRLNSRAAAVQVGGGLGIKYTFTALWPLEAIKSFKQPRQGGLDWPISGIEDAVGGFGYYLYGDFSGTNSASQGGLQVKTHKIRDGDFTPRPYMTQIFNNFVSKLRS